MQGAFLHTETESNTKKDYAVPVLVVLALLLTRTAGKVNS
jgi:hypothetical protein